MLAQKQRCILFTYRLFFLFPWHQDCCCDPVPALYIHCFQQPSFTVFSQLHRTELREEGGTERRKGKTELPAGQLYEACALQVEQRLTPASSCLMTRVLNQLYHRPTPIFFKSQKSDCQWLKITRLHLTQNKQPFYQTALFTDWMF